MQRPKRTDPVELSPRRALRLYARAARLRCPHCGGGPLLESWFRLRPRCPLRTERGEADFFLGSMMFNLILAEGALALAIVVWLVAVWPAVPWAFPERGAVLLMAAAPFVFFPFSKTIWLASDELIRPVSAAELAPSPASEPAGTSPAARRPSAHARR